MNSHLHYTLAYHYAIKILTELQTADFDQTVLSGAVTYLLILVTWPPEYLFYNVIMPVSVVERNMCVFDDIKRHYCINTGAARY